MPRIYICQAERFFTRSIQILWSTMWSGTAAIRRGGPVGSTMRSRETHLKMGTEDELPGKKLMWHMTGESVNSLFTYNTYLYRACRPTLRHRAKPCMNHNSNCNVISWYVLTFPHVSADTSPASRDSCACDLPACAPCEVRTKIEILAPIKYGCVWHLASAVPRSSLAN